jgi:hypothetical protein
VNDELRIAAAAPVYYDIPADAEPVPLDDDVEPTPHVESRQVRRARDRAEAKRRDRAVVVPALDLIDTPRPVEVMERIALANCITVAVGESGAGKTFLLLLIAACVSDGVHCLGRSVRQGSVLYLSFEGDALGLRVRALRDVAGHRLEHVYVIRAADPLSPVVTRDGEHRSVGEISIADGIEALCAQLAIDGKPPIRLIVIDTVRASLSGSEDSSEDVAAYLRVVRRLLRLVPGAACVLAHHAGWQDGEDRRKRERGSSAWRGNVDVTLYLEAGEHDASRGETRLTLRTLKIRDAERPAPLHLVRRRVELPGLVDAYGYPLTSCLIEPDRRTREDRQAEATLAAEAKHQQTDVAVLKAMRDFPQATSIARLRRYVGLGTTTVSDAVARILCAGWATEGLRGQPFTITAAGHEQLNGGGR